MLNCTDLECILHHHHYYAHQQHQLQHPPFDHRLSTSGEIVPEGAASHENETDSLQSLSHLEPPPDTVYIICGVIIAMVMVGVIIVLLAVTISKLRKREDHANEVHPEQPEVVQMAADSAIIATTTASQTTVIATSQEIRTNGIVNPVADCITASEVTGTIFLTNDLNSEKITWQFPPPYPPPHTPPPQYTLYKDQDTLVHGLDRPGFAKGIRKNLGGRWRRLVKRKSDRDTCAIPPELKDQLKTIYVY